jgi:hypothetical protein
VNRFRQRGDTRRRAPIPATAVTLDALTPLAPRWFGDFGVDGPKGTLWRAFLSIDESGDLVLPGD